MIVKSIHLSLRSESKTNKQNSGVSSGQFHEGGLSISKISCCFSMFSRMVVEIKGSV